MKSTIGSKIDLKNIIISKKRRNQVNFAAFHNSFAATRKTIEPTKLHQSILQLPPKNHKKVIQHKFSAGFKTAEMNEFTSLFDNELYTTISSDKIEIIKN